LAYSCYYPLAPLNPISNPLNANSTALRAKNYS
jgi:hypothetical protein